MKRRRANTLVALSSAAVMSVYAAGFTRTRAAAARLENSSRERPPVLPAAAPAAPAMTLLVPAQPPAPRSVAVKETPAAVAPKTPAAPPKESEAKEPKTGLTVTAVAAPSTTPEPDPAPVATPAPAAPMSPSAEILLGGTELHDGTYLGWGTSRHGDIQASVTIYSGRITAVSIAQCRTRYSCDVIAHLPGKVLKDQTPEKLNNVSGATQSVDAFYYAVVDAMNKAK